jgi:hypothetical protein
MNIKSTIIFKDIMKKDHIDFDAQGFKSLLLQYFISKSRLCHSGDLFWDESQCEKKIKYF